VHEVLALARALRSPSAAEAAEAPSAAAEEPAESDKVDSRVGARREEVRRVHAAHATIAAQALLAIAVVELTRQAWSSEASTHLALLRVGEDIVGVRQVLELVRLRRVLVRVLVV